jgi:hypothetical protein
MEAGDLPIKYIDDGQDQAALAGVVKDVRTILTPTEEILYIAMQNITALSVKKDSIVATNNRLIIYRPAVFGGVQFSDYLWEDIADVKLHEGMLAGDLTVHLINGQQESLSGLDKAQVRRLYAVAQQKEQEWREKRRIRDMEEARARAGGFHVATPAASSGGLLEDPVEKLAKAKAMLDQGLISEAEYEAVKAKIIASF